MNTTDNLNPTGKQLVKVIEAIKRGNEAIYNSDANTIYEAINELKQALTAYEKSKEEPTCKTCLNYDGSGWCILHKFNVGEQQVCPDWFKEIEQK